MSDLKENKLKDLIEKVVDNRGKTPPLSQNGYPLIETISINNSNKHPDFSKVSKFVNKETYDNWFRKGHPKIGDVLISTVGANIGNVGIMNEEKGCIAQNLVALRTNESLCNPDFLYYVLSSQETQTILKGLDIGSAQPSIKVPHLLNLKFRTPSLQNQKAIAEILSSLDDKIELNNQINQNLEALAQALFKQWFVDFEFPNENGEPYKSSGGEMIDSELGEIPKGWEVGVLQNLTVELSSGGTPKTSIKEYYVGEIEWYSTKELQDCFLTGSEKKISEEGLEKSSAKLFPKNSVIMAIYAAPTVGRLGILLNDASFNQAAVGLVANEEITSFEYIFLLLKHERQGLNSLSNGAAQQNLNVRIVKNYPIVIPNKSLSSTFKEVVRPIFEKIRINTLESENLMKLRDAVLPKLISGELEVSEASLEPTF